MSDGTTTKPVQVREGRWVTRDWKVRNVTPTPEDCPDRDGFPWWDAKYRQTWAEDGRHHVCGESPLDLVEYLGPIKPPVLQDADTRIGQLLVAVDARTEEISRLQASLDEAQRCAQRCRVDYRPRTYFIDIDGTLVQHAMKGQADNVTTSRLPGAKDFIDRLLAAGHRVILTTGRRSVLRLETEQQLSDAKIAYDELIMDLPPGIRIVVNDAKPDVPVTAYGITVPRNQGCLDIVRWEEHTLPGKAHAKVQGADTP